MCLQAVSNYIFSYGLYLIPQDFILPLCWQMNKAEIYVIWASVKIYTLSKDIVFEQLFPLSYWHKHSFIILVGWLLNSSVVVANCLQALLF